MSTKEPFTIQVPEEVLTDLHERLSNVRWAEDFANPNWEYGTNGAVLLLGLSVLRRTGYAGRKSLRRSITVKKRGGA